MGTNFRKRIAWRSDDGNDFGGSDDEDGDGNTANAYWNATKTASLLVIDATPEMFDSWSGNEDTPFRAALKCCLALWRSKLVSSPNDIVGILLSGTQKEKNSTGFNNLYILQPLSSLTVSKVEELSKMIVSDSLNDFEELIGSSTEYNLMNLFWLAKIIFEEGNAGSFSKKLMYFTCEDSPHSDNKSLRDDGIQKFKDLGNVDFSLVTFHSDFQISRFYSKLSIDESGIIFPKDLNNLMEIVRIRQRVKRPTCRTLLRLAPGFAISVGVYALVRTSFPPKKISVDSTTNEPVSKVVNRFRADTGVTVLKSEELKVATIGGETIRFDKDELTKSSSIHQSEIRVLGYVPKSNFDELITFHSNSYFLYPDEGRVIGSTDVFTTFLRRCHALNKIAIVKMKLRRGTNTKIACLIPSVGIEAEDRTKLPDGFHVHILPFSDEVRQFQPTPGRDAAPELVALMEKIIRKTSNKGFDLNNVYNPTLQHQYRQIERLALDQIEGIEEDDFLDYTQPNEAIMKARTEKISREFNQVAANSRQEPLAIAGPSKKPINIAMEAKNKRLDKLTRIVLADFLDSVGIKTFRKTKAQVVDMVYEYFEDGES